MKLSELANFLRAELKPGNAESNCKSVEINRVASIDQAKAGEITFLANPDYFRFLATTRASAVIVAEEYQQCKIPQLVHRNPYFAFAKTAQLFHQPKRGEPGIAESASVHPSAKIADGVSILPFCSVDAETSIGKGSYVMSNVSIGKRVCIGENCTIFPNVVIYDGCEIGNGVILHAGCVIGADGFGYAVGEGEIVKIPQTGIVVIEDNVEIGATSSVDRAAIGVTRIKKNSKLDSRVQVGHNVEIGENCMLSAFTGLAGSSKLGDWVVMGGQSGLNSHTTIASGCKIGARTGVVKDIEKKGDYLGFPAVPAGEWRRRQVYLKKLSEYEKRLRELERRLLEEDTF